MKRHRSFEFLAAKVAEKMGFENVDVTRGVADWGADLFCERDGKRYVGQVKMYGTSRTRMSRKDVMELYGVMAYFDCQGAFFIYSGKVGEDARRVAEKLGIALYCTDGMELDSPETDEYLSEGIDFASVWENYVKPLEGREVITLSGVRYRITEVTDGAIRYVNSSGKHHLDRIDYFKWMIDRMNRCGEAYAIDLRNEFKMQSSSFVTAVLGAIPLFRVEPGRKVVPAALEQVGEQPD